MQIAITRPLAANRTVRTAATIVAAAAAATGVVAASTGGFSDGISTPPKAAQDSAPGPDLSVYDDEILRHHGVKVIPARQPAVSHTPAAQRFHHGR